MEYFSNCNQGLAKRYTKETVLQAIRTNTYTVVYGKTYSSEILAVSATCLPCAAGNIQYPLHTVLF